MNNERTNLRNRLYHSSLVALAGDNPVNNAT